ncbi:hypothetical protein RJ639_010369 [Escallonia herrerae]|uniref:Mediator of RNA polymerase II transcription subunit n=1 Tax=Escallonia herrerae TaxID=1293975 RepID=A0AA88VNI2_9ASTE|nr:hypothetical protein RJ639_010369 [Escallonia herrerae]
MEATSLCSPILPPPAVSTQPQKRRFPCLKRHNAKVVASGRESYYGGRSIVDESMIVLRKRIHEMKLMERNYEPPRDWMEWEKQYFACYDENICGLVGLLQLALMNTRPSFALGMLALITMSVPASVVMVASHLTEAAGAAFSAIHLS